MATVTLDGVGKLYGKTRAVEALDLDIADGELIVIVGPSGCGKSTLLRMVAGLETISEGTLKIDGEAMNRVEPARRDIAMVFQNYALYPHMSVRENISYGLRNRRMPRRRIRERVEEVARTLGLEALLDRRPAQLSGGQRQRVAMGRAIAREPKVFLFDEPLSNLDAKLRVQMRLEIRRLQRRLGTTSLYVTHDQVEAMTLADRLVVMNEGRVEQIGTPAEVYDRPATTFVAGFIGSPPMNILPARFLDRALPRAAGSAEPGAKAEIGVGIRPEDFVVREPAGAALAGMVEMVEDLGSDSFAHVSLVDPEGEIRIVVRGGAGTRFEEGSPVGLDLRPDRMRFYAKEGRLLQPGGSA